MCISHWQLQARLIGFSNSYCLCVHASELLRHALLLLIHYPGLEVYGIDVLWKPIIKQCPIWNTTNPQTTCWWFCYIINKEEAAAMQLYSYISVQQNDRISVQTQRYKLARHSRQCWNQHQGRMEGGAWGAEAPSPPSSFGLLKEQYYISYISSGFQLCSKNLSQFSQASPK